MRRVATAEAVHANRGTRARYRRAMMRLIDEMASSVEYWLTARRRSDPPVLAQDALPTDEMQQAFRKVSARWQEKFDGMAEEIAKEFLKQSFRGTDSAMRAALKKAGWAIDFKMTRGMRDAFKASLAENVSLIRSIPTHYLQQVEGIVMRSYARGRDLHTMVKEIRKLYPKAKNRAVLIARDQSNKANAVVQQARQKELGITTAIWIHSHAGKTPRPSHLAMNGKRFEVEKGVWDPDEGKWVLPGELINCRCVSKAVLPWTPAER